MSSTLGWIELSSDALRKLRRDLLAEAEGVVDEIGVGAIHSGYADHFFPGTSVLQKRPRYLFFTCWNYLLLDRIDGDRPHERKELAEEWVRDRLMKAGQKNVIGARVRRPAQPVDFIYWTALRSWGFYRGVSRSTLLQNWSEITPQRIGRLSVPESEFALEPSTALFYVTAPPHDWLRQRPRGPLTFDLESAEAAFLRDRLQSLRTCVLSEAASLAYQVRSRGSELWTDEVVHQAADQHGELDMIQRAKCASSIALIVRAIYAALVEKLRNDTITPVQRASVSDSQYYARELSNSLIGPDSVSEDASRLNLDLLRQDLPSLDSRLISLLRHVQQRMSRIRKPIHVRILLDDSTLQLFRSAEIRRKGPVRARLSTTPLGLARRTTFDESTVVITGINYRWQTVQMLLRDLHDGLRR